MGKFSIPNPTGIVRQLNINDTYGELWSSFNLDIRSNPGKLKLARPLKRVADGTDLDDDWIEALAYDGNNAYAVTRENLYSADSGDDFEVWGLENTADVSRAEDAVVFQGQLVISTSNNLDAFDLTQGGTFGDFTSNWWTARGNPSLTSNNPVSQVPRVLEVAHIGTETLVVLDGSEVHAYTGGITSGAIINLTMDIDSAYTACCFKSGIRKGWIGTYTELADEALIFEWDVASTNYIQAYPLGAKAALAMCLDEDDAPIIITERGEIKKFNNSGFVIIGQMPFTLKPLFTDSLFFNANNTLRPVHPKGMKRVGRDIYIMLNFKTNLDLPIDERTPSGIWVFNLDTRSFTHLASQNNEYSFLRTSPLMMLDLADSRIFVGGAIDRASGDEVGIWLEDLADDAENFGYLTSTEIETADIRDSFNEIAAKAQMYDDNALKVKWRNGRDIMYPISAPNCVWLNNNTFNTTDDLSYVKARFDAAFLANTDFIGDEVEIVGGSGAGKLAHITNVELSTNVYSVTINEEIGTAGEDLKARFDNWNLVPKDMTGESGDTERFGTGDSGSFGQYKVEMRGYNGYPEIRNLLVSTKNKEKN